MSRTFLIDGYNLLHQVLVFKPGQDELETMRERLLHRLVSLSAQRGIKIRVVFDGPRAADSGTRYPGINITFASPSADHFIRAAIEKNSGRRDLIIVSSDQKDIGNYARLNGVQCMASQQFWQWLSNPTTFDKKTQESSRNDTGAPPGWTAADDEDYLRRLDRDDTDFGEL